ncbi:MAG: hypothetical protein K2X38_15125 [Gemmataceae bacterium]|nr:hypothetical protein [Gemmataceae bacterium]
MIAGYHVIFSAYGFWLPNDPRGSWSDFVGARELFRFGPATKTATRNSVASLPHDRSTRMAAKSVLKRPAVKFNGLQARAIGRAFSDYVAKSKLQVWACAIVPDHVHLVLGPLDMDVEHLVIQMKAAATREMESENIHPFQFQRTKTGRVYKCFARGEWKVYLDREDIPRAIRYVEGNPEKEGLPRQRWTFVSAYAG